MDSENIPSSRPDQKQDKPDSHSVHSQWMELSFVASSVAILSDFLGLLAARRNAAKAVVATVITNIAAWGTAIYAQYRAHKIGVKENQQDKQELLEKAKETARNAAREELSGQQSPVSSGSNKWQRNISQESSLAKDSAHTP